MTHPSPPRPNLKEMVERLREHASLLDMRPEDTLEWQAADAIDSLLSERAEARKNTLEEAAKVAVQIRDGYAAATLEGVSEDRLMAFGTACNNRAVTADEIVQALRAMRGNAE